MKPVNLIPQEQRRRTPREGSGKSSYAVLGVLGLLLAMVVAYVLTSNSVTDRQSKADAARAQADQLEAQAAQKGDFTDFAEIAQTRTQSVSTVAAGRFDWERFMRELARVMPAGSWLQSADSSLLGDVGEGGTSGTAEQPTAEPKANLVGCTPSQSDVARMMVRLRQLHRVQDVELGASTKEESSDAASIDSCGANYKFDVTLKFTPAAPASEAPRGASRVPVSLGGGS
jgi:Tfp pilus assembly protein PilN